MLPFPWLRLASSINTSAALKIVAACKSESPRAGSPAICSGCHRQAPGYGHLPDRQFEFIPVWGYLVFLLYRMRRVDCKTCGVIVEAVPWADGKQPSASLNLRFIMRLANYLNRNLPMNLSDESLCEGTLSRSFNTRFFSLCPRLMCRRFMLTTAELKVHSCGLSKGKLLSVSEFIA